MDKHSPTPWRVDNINQTYHVEAADGSFVALFVREANAALIVEAVNERARLRDLVRRLVTDWEPFVNDGPLSYPDERQRAATIREAREALGEAQP